MRCLTLKGVCQNLPGDMFAWIFFNYPNLDSLSLSVSILWTVSTVLFQTLGTECRLLQELEIRGKVTTLKSSVLLSGWSEIIKPLLHSTRLIRLSVEDATGDTQGVIPFQLALTAKDRLGILEIEFMPTWTVDTLHFAVYLRKLASSCTSTGSLSKGSIHSSHSLSYLSGRFLGLLSAGILGVAHLGRFRISSFDGSMARRNRILGLFGPL